MSRIVIFSFVLFSCVGEAVSQIPTSYSIGNSLTAQMRPDNVPNAFSHIACGRNLQQIFENPEYTSNDTTYYVTAAFTDQQFDFVFAQPFHGTSLEQDRDVISHWVALQPHAVFVINSAWTYWELFPGIYEEGNPNDLMRVSPEYMQALIDELKQLHPTTDFRQTKINQMFYRIYTDSQAGLSPFSYEDMQQDNIHTNALGQYLAHNSMRYIMGAPHWATGVFDITDEDRAYLDDLLWEFVVVPGDFDRDGAVTLLDIQPFIERLSSSAPWMDADLNRDGIVNLQDVPEFIDLLTN